MAKGWKGYSAVIPQGLLANVHNQQRENNMSPGLPGIKKKLPFLELSVGNPADLSESFLASCCPSLPIMIHTFILGNRSIDTAPLMHLPAETRHFPGSGKTNCAYTYTELIIRCQEAQEKNWEVRGPALACSPANHLSYKASREICLPMPLISPLFPSGGLYSQRETIC